MLQEIHEFGSLPTEELIGFEEENDVQLPSDYRDFLLNFNGGAPQKFHIRDSPYLVTYFLGMHNGPLAASMYKHIDLFQGRLPFSTFPIATDPFGNLFIMSVHPEGYGHIYFWDHEGEPEIQDGHYTDNCSFVTYSFSELLNSLE